MRLDREVFENEVYSKFINNHYLSIRIKGDEGEGKKFKAHQEQDGVADYKAFSSY